LNYSYELFKLIREKNGSKSTTKILYYNIPYYMFTV